MRLFSILLFSGFMFAPGCTNTNSDQAMQAGNGNAVPETRFIKQTIEPAFENLDVRPVTLTVKGTNAQTLRLPSGSSIEVPLAAFVDAQGQPVTGDVNIVFREFHSAADLMASGIPMKVMGENGEEAWMQTAGMYEINGFQNGQPVFVAPGKSLNVNLVSAVDGAYDFWYFDPAAGNWENRGVSMPVPNETQTATASVPDKVLRKADPPPVEPVAFRENTPAIDLDINLKKFPELAGKRGIIWQYAGKDAKQDPANNPELLRKNWDEINLTSNPDGRTYTLTMTNDDETVKLPVAPALKGKDLEQAKADYQRRLAGYRKKLASAQQAESFRDEQREFVRSFQIQGFGIYNYDILMKMRNAIPILANFDFGTDIPANLRNEVNVYLIAGNGRMVVNFPPSNWKNFRLDPDLDNSLVAVLPGNQLAILSKEDLKKQMDAIRDAKGREYVFQLKVQEQPVKSVREVQERLVAL